jgi:copper(I)-binding protein
MTRLLRTCIALISVALVVPAPAGEGEITASGAWIAAGPPVVKINAGYLRIDNSGTAAATLTGAESPLFARIEMHSSELQNGMIAMRRENAVEIPAGGSAAFSPGALHLMLFDGNPAPLAGESIPLRLIFADGRRVEVSAEVREPVAGDTSHHEHHH